MATTRTLASRMGVRQLGSEAVMRTTSFGRNLCTSSFNNCSSSMRNFRGSPPVLSSPTSARQRDSFTRALLPRSLNPFKIKLNRCQLPMKRQVASLQQEQAWRLSSQAWQRPLSNPHLLSRCAWGWHGRYKRSMAGCQSWWIQPQMFSAAQEPWPDIIAKHFIQMINTWCQDCAQAALVSQVAARAVATPAMARAVRLFCQP